ncbi:gp55 [Sodalis phage phiSG1]|nr:gp55 [Sodalis phage phiSG1]
MTTFVDTGRPGKKRYRVRYQGIGGSRTAEFADMNDACREYFQREKHMWRAISEKEVQRKRPVTIRELMIFYFGRLCDELEMNNIGRDYFLGQKGVFLSLYQRWRGSKTPIVDITTPDLKPISLHNHRRFIRRAYDCAINVGMCNINPCTIENKSRNAAWKGTTRKYAKYHEVQRLMQSDEPRQRLAVYLGAACGLRLGEVAMLSYDNIFDDSIVLDRHLTKSGDYPGIKYGVDNEIPVTPEFHRLLNDVQKGNSRFVFESSRGSHFSMAGFSKSIVMPAFVKADFKKTFHSLRHYAVSVWVERGVSLVQISQWLGHASPEVTLRTYAHLFKRTGDKCFLVQPG